MLEYTDMSTKKQRNWVPGLWTLILAVLLFVMTLIGVALLEANQAHSDEHQLLGNVFLVRRLWSKFGAGRNASTDDAVAATVERIARDAKNASRTTATGRSNNYYEEQQAVVVKEESAPPPMAERIDSFGPPQGRSYEVDSNYDTADDYGGEQFDSPEDAGEGRAALGRPNDSYYAQWQYATQTTAPPMSSNNRKLQPAGDRPPYGAYDDVYDYPMGFQPRPQEQIVSKQAVSAAPVHAVAYPPASTESSLVTFLKTLKQMWDLYQALMSAWGSVAERHQKSTEQLKKERQEKQRLRQQQQQQQNKSRINSKKPQRGNANKDAKPNQNKKVKTTTTTTSTTSSSNKSNESDEAEEATAAPVAIVNAVKANDTKVDAAQQSSERGMRHRREPEAASTDVGEGRYIKGDPLKGYYDFVITEGSYKFWAAFQVGTALLIIYSTFAAIYYSKVNPLTSDYDYQDYLGAGRSMTGGDDDFVDDSEPSTPTKTTSSIMDWLPRTAHSIKFILDAIDKMPLDHDHKAETGWSTGKSETTDNASGASS